MSCYQFAEGTIILPKKDYMKIVKHFNDEFFNILTKEVAIYNNFVEKLTEQYKGKRNLDWPAIWEKFLYEKSEIRDPEMYFQSIDNLSRVSHIYNNFYSYFQEKPKKIKTSEINNFMKVFLKNTKSSDVNVSGTISHEEASISFNKNSHCVRFYVSDNNHSVDRFKKSDLFKIINNLLKTVQWTRNTGGTVLMNDEYTIEAMGAGYPLIQYNVKK